MELLTHALAFVTGVLVTGVLVVAVCLVTTIVVGTGVAIHQMISDTSR